MFSALPVSIEIDLGRSDLRVAATRQKDRDPPFRGPNQKYLAAPLACLTLTF